MHEVKFDGWRAQLHVDGDGYALFTKNGADYTKRLNQIAHIAKSVPAKNAILDCELIACDDTGMPCFRTLMELGNKATLCLVAFDLLHLDGVRLTPIPIEERKAILKMLVAKVGWPYLQFSDTFEDPAELLDTCVRMNFEGIVSKRKGSAYRTNAGLAQDQDCELARGEPAEVGDISENGVAAAAGWPHDHVTLLQADHIN